MIGPLGRDGDKMTSITDIDLSKIERVYLKVETNKDFTSYTVNEEMIFAVSLFADGKQITAPFFKCTFFGDDGKESAEYIPAATGTVTFTATLSCAGMVRLVVEIADGEKCIVENEKITKFEGGALADARNIAATVCEPEDFNEFWAGQLKLLE